LKEPAPHIFEPETREEFDIWCEMNPDGWLLNELPYRPPEYHYGTCGHFKGNVGKDLVTNRKIVSKNNRLLLAWWDEQGGPEPEVCPDCAPEKPGRRVVL